MDALGLVERRLAIINELAGLEEMRRGSVVEQYQERTLPTGEKVLRGPYPLYSYKEKGRTISRRLKSEKEVLRYREQIQNFRRFEGLTRELLLIGEQLCELGSDQEKNSGIRRRTGPRKPRLLKRISRQPSFDLEAVESVLRTAILAAGARLLAKLLEDVDQGRRNKPVVCACGMPMRSRGLEEKTVLTILGEVRFSRSRYECPRCHASRYPGDEELGVEGTSRSPGVRRMMARAGSRHTFKDARDDLGIYAGVQVSAKDVERVAEGLGEEIEVWQAQQREFLLTGQLESSSCASVPTMYIEMDGTGVPMTRQELAGRKGKQADGTSRTREAKLGCVFTQTELDEKGRPRRDPDTTIFVGAIETVEDFGARIVRIPVKATTCYGHSVKNTK
ncbi:MAG: DUF6788 family protein [Pseudomonadota bacterium]